MKKSVFFLIGIFTWVCISTTLAQQPLSQQKLLQPLQLTTSTVKIDKFLSVLQTATSLKDVQTAFIQANFSQDEIKQLQARIEASPVLKQKLDGLYKQGNEAAKIESAKKTTEEARQVAIVTAQLNQNLMIAHQEATNKIKVSFAAIQDPEFRCQADTPSISEVSGVMPGVEFAVQGMGFGKDPGTVDVMTGGFVYAARINRWNSCVTYAQLSPDIQGVRPDNQAAVSLKTSAGREVRFYTRFTPLTESRVYTNYDYIDGWFWGASKDYSFWNRVLKNDWYVLITGLQTYYSRGEGHAEITLSPPTNTPNCSTFTRVHAGVAALSWLGFDVLQRIAGPKGTPPY
jgi:hypothetical protein